VPVPPPEPCVSTSRNAAAAGPLTSARAGPAPVASSTTLLLAPVLVTLEA
jgi:hypothetical protein